VTAPGTGRDLRLLEVSKRFGPMTAVDNLSLTIPEGSFFALLGPSGCGKTTTLRMVAGLDQPEVSSGTRGHAPMTFANLSENERSVASSSALKIGRAHV